MDKTIFLIGPRAAGKSSVGRLLAADLNCAFADTDRYIEEKNGRSVEDIVKREGWEGFRLRESAALKDVSKPSTIVATGGGMILAESNRVFMAEHGLVLYLMASAEILVQRILALPKHKLHPSLTGKSVDEEMAEVLKEREVLYYKAAHHVIDACAPLNDVKDDILLLLKTHSY